eukprot:6186715-Pleurochrysis_carterae.AAC.2
MLVTPATCPRTARSGRTPPPRLRATCASRRRSDCASHEEGARLVAQLTLSDASQIRPITSRRASASRRVKPCVRRVNIRVYICVILCTYA